MKVSNLTFLLVLAAIFAFVSVTNAAPIDRYAVVHRHNIVDANQELPLGNGEFCFNIDPTGLQTRSGGTFSHWGWHNFPLPAGVSPADIPATATYQQGRNQGQHGDISFPKEKDAIRQWLRDNPHIANLIRIGFVHADGTEISPKESITISERCYDLWTGLHTSRFTLDGVPVEVETFVRMDEDTVCIRCKSSLLNEKKLGITIQFPYPSIKNTAINGEFNASQKHRSHVVETGHSEVARWTHLEHCADDLTYDVFITTDSHTSFDFTEAEHKGLISTTEDSLTLAVRLKQRPTELIPLLSSRVNRVEPTPESRIDFETQKTQTAESWKQFWKSGAAVDLSESKDPRWKEMERRIVLSQYLTRTNSAGRFPPAESGLMKTDPWCGKFHGEMIYWHVAHFSLWNRQELSDDALDCYRRFMPLAQQLAKQLGYAGAQWGKAMGPEGQSSPWNGNQVLLWKQPHPILFAELEYRVRPTQQTLHKWAEIIEQTALYMASYPTQDEQGKYHLIPVMPPSETGIFSDTVFDLAYWRWGLDNANRWRERLGQKRNEQWDKIRLNLAPLPTFNTGKPGEEVYVRASDVKRDWEHPDTVGEFGMVPPTAGVDPQIAKRSVKRVFETWDWNRCWGWDFPWTAMGAARTGQPEIAVDILLKDAQRNNYDARGLNNGWYLPGNGGFLYAIGMMVGGWDGAPEVDREKGEAPGFPRNGLWTVRAEGFIPAP